jgi:peptidoglycan/LPS O-acetylase OafA/YrhL
VTTNRVAGSGQRFAALDGLRFFAAFAVVIYHLVYSKRAPSELSGALVQGVVMHGYLGVHLFFLISGFVIFWSSTGRTPSAFVKARIVRLYPEFWLCVLVSAFVFSVVEPGQFASPAIFEVLANLSMVPGYLGSRFVDDVYWTLAVEIKFYALVWLLMITRQFQHVELWLLGWIALVGLGSVMEIGSILRSLAIFPYGALFAAGGLFFLVFQHGWTLPRFLGVFVALVASAYHAMRGMEGFVPAEDVSPLSVMVTSVLMVAMFGAVAFAVQARPAARHASLLAFAGSLTYPLYLLHNTGKELFFPLPPDTNRTSLIILAILYSLVAAYAVKRLGTGPVRRLLQQALSKVPGLRVQRGGPWSGPNAGVEESRGRQ